MSRDHVGGRLPVVVRFWTIVWMVVRNVVCAYWLVVPMLPVVVTAGEVAAVIGGGVGVVG